jgi:hypothetical protein
MISRMKTPRGLSKSAVAIVIALLGIPLLVAATWGADVLDSWLPDAVGADAKAWLRTQDAAPGDTVAIRVVGKAGYKTAITSLTARFGSAQVAIAGSEPTWGSSISSRSTNEDETRFVFNIPDDTPQGDSMIQVTVAMVIAVPTGGRTFENRDSHNVLQVPIMIRSPGGRTFQRWLDRGIALGAWALAFTAAYWLLRARPRARPDANSDPNVYLYMLLALVGIAIVGMGGQLVFVRSILRTTAAQSWVLTTGLMVVWLLALVAGGWRGERRRMQDLRFWPARVRAVIGTPPISTAFREAASTLPPSLSRDADRHTEAELIKALEAAGCAVTRRRKRLDVTSSSQPVMRIWLRRPAPWIPEDLQILIFDRADPTPWLCKLADLYGPVEYTSPRGEPAIVEPTGVTQLIP